MWHLWKFSGMLAGMSASPPGRCGAPWEWEQRELGEAHQRKGLARPSVHNIRAGDARWPSAWLEEVEVATGYLLKVQERQWVGLRPPRENTAPRALPCLVTQHLWMFLSEERMGRGGNASPPATGSGGKAAPGEPQRLGLAPAGPLVKSVDPGGGCPSALEF